MRKSKVLISRARALRLNYTDAENVLWYNLRNRRLNNYKFKRQIPIGNYIADFVCEEKRLIVEVDGGQHSECMSYDQKRTEFLRSERYQVLRFWNDEVLGQTEQVLEAILRALDGY